MARTRVGSLIIPRFVKRMILRIASSGKLANSRVKSGHFAVYTIDEGKFKRSMVELVNLNHPGFFRLLKRAEEEFGFCHNGVLVIPCGPDELERILKHKEWMKSTWV